MKLQGKIPTRVNLFLTQAASNTSSHQAIAYLTSQMCAGISTGAN